MNITAIIIATRDDLRFDSSAKPANNGKYLGWISLPPEDNYRPLINTEPIFKSKRAAVEGMKVIDDKIREHGENETGGENPIDYVMKQAGAEADEINAVKSIVAASG